MKLSEAETIESKIYLIRNVKVMLDRDLAELYEVSTKQLNQQVRRNEYRFPSDFMFSMENHEVVDLKSQIVTSSLAWGGRRKPPLVFTEQGIAMLSSVLNSRRAIEVNIAIIRTFVNLREVLKSNKELETKLTALEARYDGKFKIVFEAIRKLMSAYVVPPKRVIGLSPKDE